MVTDLKDCRQCKYWSYDMDMDPFCLHPKIIEQVGSFGLYLHRARANEGLCGPAALLFTEKEMVA